jgi:hypothetical protein
MDNESVRVLIEIGWGYVKAGRMVPMHVVADLFDAVRCPDAVSFQLRNQAERLLRECA